MSWLVTGYRRPPTTVPILNARVVLRLCASCWPTVNTDGRLILARCGRSLAQLRRPKAVARGARPDWTVAGGQFRNLAGSIRPGADVALSKAADSKAADSKAAAVSVPVRPNTQINWRWKPKAGEHQHRPSKSRRDGLVDVRLEPPVSNILLIC